MALACSVFYGALAQAVKGASQADTLAIDSAVWYTAFGVVPCPATDLRRQPSLDRSQTRCCGGSGSGSGGGGAGGLGRQG